MIEIINNGILYRNPQPDLGPIAAFFPVVVPLSDTEMICAYLRASTLTSADARVAQLRSVDGGATWTEEGLIWDGSGDDRPYEYNGCGLTMRNDGTLLLLTNRFDRSEPDKPLYNPETEGYLPVQIILVQSRDGGHTWSLPQTVPLPERLMGNAAGRVFELDDGELLLPLETWKAYDDPNPPPQRAMALFSTDKGATWGNLTTVGDGVADGVFYWDQRIISLGS